MAKIDEMNACNQKQQKNSKVAMTIPSLEELRTRYLISDISQIRECLNQRNFMNKAMVIACQSMFLEFAGHIFISYQLSNGLVAYRMEPTLVYLMVNFSQWSDAGGIFFGKAFGKDKFAESISPTKTRQGIYGALILPMLISILFFLINTKIRLIDLTLFDFLFLSIITAILGIIGDLMESYLKRCSNLKDSGQLLQDHGGVLDRVDSTLFNCSLYAWIAREYISLKTLSIHDPSKSALLQILFSKRFPSSTVFF